MSADHDGFRNAPVRAGAEADARLAELGLRVNLLHTALEAGHVSASQATRFHPVMAAGSLRWFDTVGRLRELLAELGWEADDVRNSPRIVSPDGRIALLVVRGDRNTAVSDRDPQTARARGRATVRAVTINGQLELPLDLQVLADASAERRSGVETWILLHRPTEGGEVRAELSLPVTVDETGFVTGWSERILLPPLTFGPEVAPTRDIGDDGQGDGDVEVGVSVR